MRRPDHRGICRLLLLILCGISIRVSAQEISNLGHQAWTTENGIPQNSIHAIFQSRDGYLWIATKGGIARFNGNTFRIFRDKNTPAITSNDICCFAQSADGDLWIGTADGILRYSNGSFRHYGTAEGLPSEDVRSLLARDGAVYVLTGSGLAHLNGDRFTPIETPIAPDAIALSDEGILISTSSGLMEYRGSTTARAYQQLMPAKQPVLAFGYLPNDTLWQRTSTTLTVFADGNPRTLNTEAFGSGRIQSFLTDSHGGLWIGTSKGLYHLQDPLAPPRLLPDLGTNSILSLREDAEGDLWVGTETDGLHILRHRNFHSLPGSIGQRITAITQAGDGVMWIGTNGDGLMRWLNGNQRTLTTRDGLLSNIILSLTPGQSDDLWIGTPDGLNHLQQNHLTSLTSADGLPDDFIRSLLTDDDGTLWIGTRKGLAHLDGKKISIVTQANGLPSDVIGAMVQPIGSNDLWIATLGGLSFLHNGSIKTFTTADGLSGNTITSLFMDAQGNLWIGTHDNGLTVRTVDGRFIPFHRSDLPRTVDTLIGDDTGSLWLGSTHGILRARQFDLVACASSPACTLHLNRYGSSDGMPTEEVSAIGHPAVWKSSDGTLWFATGKGVAIVDPAHLFLNQVPPPVVIERFTVDDVEQSAGVDIHPGPHRLAFEYAGLSFLAPGQVRFRYRLEGFDKQWIEAGSRRTASYTNLPSGHYRFIVQAANNDGLWNEQGAQLSFSIQSPFYRTLCFLLLVSLLLIGLFVLLYRLRPRRLRSQFDTVLRTQTSRARNP
jgi:ligand-binding sensor domain-containing protein